MLFSIVVPCYNEQEALPLFYTEITLSLIHIWTLPTNREV